MKFNVIEFPSRMFTWSDGGRAGCCEASDMGNRHLQRLYDDAMDVGFAVTSDKTGQVVRFYMDEVHRDGEGEITHWTYKACQEDIRKVHSWRVEHVTMTVFND